MGMPQARMTDLHACMLPSTPPLFDGMRPTSESAVGFAEALKQSNRRDADLILSLDSKILETALP